VVLISFLLAFNHNLRKVLLKWLEIGGAYLFLWFPTASAEEYVDYLNEKLKAIHAKKKGTVDAPEAEAVPGATVEQAGQPPEAGLQNVVNGGAQAGRGLRRRVVDVEQQAVPPPRV
jgi:hypothetical protein